MAGGPSHIDLFDPKPTLQKWDGQALPESMSKNLNLAFIKPTAKIWPSPRTFKPYGDCGTEFSDLHPAHRAANADDLCLIRSMYTEQINHHPGQLMMNCGSQFVGRPSMGAWVTYGLGSESQDLPGFVVLSSGGGTSAGSGNWTSGFLPSTFQGVPFRSVGDPVPYLSNPAGVTKQMQRERLDLLRGSERSLDMPDRQIRRSPRASPRTSWLSACRWPRPELLDVSKESPATLEMYGVNERRQHGSSRPIACSRGVWWSAACAS